MGCQRNQANCVLSQPESPCSSPASSVSNSPGLNPAGTAPRILSSRSREAARPRSRRQIRRSSHSSEIQLRSLANRATIGKYVARSSVRWPPSSGSTRSPDYLRLTGRSESIAPSSSSREAPKGLWHDLPTRCALFRPELDLRASSPRSQVLSVHRTASPCRVERFAPQAAADYAER